MNYTNMLYIAITSLLVASSSSNAMEAGSYTKTPRDMGADETTESYTSEVVPHTTFVEPSHKPSARRAKDSLLTPDEKAQQQRAPKNTNAYESYINSDDIKEFNKSRKTKKSKSSCFGCFK